MRLWDGRCPRAEVFFKSIILLAKYIEEYRILTNIFFTILLSCLYHFNMKQNESYSTGEAARLFGVTTRTIQKWDASGRLTARRTPTNRRYYLQEDIDAFLKEKPSAVSGKKDVIYCRVSSRGQKNDLRNQKDFLRTFCNARGVIVSEVIEDIGSGLNYRPVFRV